SDYNYSILNSMAIVDVTIPNDGSTERAEKVLKDLLNSMAGKYEALIKAPEFLGIEKSVLKKSSFALKRKQSRCIILKSVGY
ncbi:hypothetical protein KEH51_06930, partial [[Brevibacterium] frigoritolerans]|nr:hypothetical protein [Peribacillus frigoritolerans]